MSDYLDKRIINFEIEAWHLHKDLKYNIKVVKSEELSYYELQQMYIHDNGRMRDFLYYFDKYHKAIKDKDENSNT